MTQLSLMFLMVAALVTALDWRRGFLMCIVVGVAQDPLRKLTPGQPVYFVLFVGAIFALTWIRAWMARLPLGPGVLNGWPRNLRTPYTLFIVVVLAQALHSYVLYGSEVVSGIGLLVWLSPLPAVILAYQFAMRRGLPGVKQWFKAYVFVALLALLGVYLEYIGVGWKSLGEVGDGLVIYDLGGILKAHSGFFRASEIAAWHTAAVACFVFTLAVGKRPTLLRVCGWVALIAAVVTLGMLTGRRKMLVEVTIFLTTYLFLVAWFQKGMAKVAMSAVILGLAGYVAIVGFVSPDLVQESYTKSMHLADPQRLEGYALRGQSAFADLPRRVYDVGWQPLVWSIQNFGWFGAGLGTASQGTSEALNASNWNRGGVEGGFGKVAMELGIPGLLVLIWLARAMAVHLRAHFVPIAKLSPRHMRIAFGLLSFLIANAATFSVATQAYSDLFILLILGWCIGFLLAMPVLAARDLSAAQVRAGLSIPAEASRPGPGWQSTGPYPLPLVRPRQ